ncbi:Cloroperoxidase [Lactifluus volemus]|nr:Cloroperoxidase [Lactifluus volemus]
MVLIITTLRRIGREITASIFEFCFLVYLFSWDISLTLINVLTFKRTVGRVTPKGHPGEGGIWPEYIPPKPGDSRCGCPALNAMANHGIISRDGRNISFRDLSRKVGETFNISPTFCIYVPRYAAHILNRSYNSGRFDLSDVDAHNGIEHDASLVRRDTYLQNDQGPPDGQLVASLLKCATGPPPRIQATASYSPLPSSDSPYFDVAVHVAKALADFDMNRTLTATDLSRRLGVRRPESRRDNGQYSLDFRHKIFGSANGSTMLTVFGGCVPDLYTFLVEERLPDGWESRARDRMGLTMFSFTRVSLRIEFGVKEEVDQPLNLM